MAEFPLGRKVPGDWVHVERYPLRAIMPETIATVEDVLPLPYAYRPKYDQGSEGACVGFASSWMVSIFNRRFYDARWLYKSAQQIDEWEGDSYSGTSVRAGMDVLREVGHRRNVRGVSQPPDMAHGIVANRWATNVDEVRACVAAGGPVVLGINWYTNFDKPAPRRGADGFVPNRPEWYIGVGDLGTVRGGHAICVYGASDRRQAVKLVNSWGTRYQLVWLPYSVLARLLSEDGEATIVTDR